MDGWDAVFQDSGVVVCPAFVRPSIGAGLIIVDASMSRTSVVGSWSVFGGGVERDRREFVRMNAT